MNAETFASRLAKSHKTSGGWRGCCPAHNDTHPSLDVAEGDDGRILLTCRSHGCTPDAIVAALGLAMGDLFPDSSRRTAPPSVRKPAVAASQPFDWKACREAFTPDWEERICEWRGYSPEFVRWLHGRNQIGVFRNDVAFPVTRDGQRIGTHFKAGDGWQYYPNGCGTEPLSIGGGSEVWVFESQWDLFAVADRLKVHTPEAEPVGLFCTRGSANGALIAGHFPQDATVFAWVQNDPVKQPGKLPPAETWFAKLSESAGCPVVRVETPLQHKDANDWTRSGATEEELRAALDRARASKPPPSGMPPREAVALADLKPRDPEGDNTEIIRNGYLCRGGGALLVGPTGTGKSSLAMQFAILWAIGRDCFGAGPRHPVRSLMIQAENDQGDLAEMRDGIIAGLGLTPEEAALAKANVLIITEDSRTSTSFFAGTVAPALEKYKPDLLWIDPALAYIGGESNSQRDVGAFLRNGLNPLIHQHNCAAIVCHHSNKPPQGKEKGAWGGSDLAYLGSGSAEWCNWARAVLALRSIGEHGVFELVAAKRGARLRWRDADGNPVYTKTIAHAKDGGIYWRLADAEEVPKSQGRPKGADTDDIVDLIRHRELTTTEWEAVAGSERGISRRTFFRLKRDAERAGKVKQSLSTQKWYAA